MFFSTDGKKTSPFLQAFAKLTKADLSVWAMYKIKELGEELMKKYNLFGKARDELIMKYWQETEKWKFSVDGNSENAKEFFEKLDELVKIEIELQLEKISIEMKEDEKIWLSTLDLELLSPVFEIKIK